MNILVTGANGQLGTEMRLLSQLHKQHRYFFADVMVPENATETTFVLDITDGKSVEAFVGEKQINCIVNCAAYTNVDRAEEDEAMALKINAEGVACLAGAAAKWGAKVVHVSTDYVFSGEEHEPCLESDPVAPRTAYGRTKLKGEQLLQKICPDAVIIRTAWLYSPFGNNFVKTMLRLSESHDVLKVVYDQIGTPTYAADLATAIFAAIESENWHAGIYHYTNEGVCSWFDFTHEIMRQAGKGVRVLPILSNEYAYRTPRPHYSVLNKSKIKTTFGVEIPHWTESLHKCLERLNEINKT